MKPSPPPTPRTGLDLIERALTDPRVRRDILIALAMVLFTVVLSAWLLAGMGAWLTIGGTAAGIGAGLAARRKRRQAT